MADNGAAYTVTVTNAAGTVTSNAATLTVTPLSATLSFSQVPAHTFGDPAFPVSATSASSGAVTYTIASGPATIAGNTVTLTGAGTVQLTATQAAAGNYAPTTANTSFNVTAATPTLAFATVPAQT